MAQSKKKTTKRKVAKKKTTKKKPTRKTAGSRARAVARRVEQELPKNLRHFVDDVQRELNRLEKDLEKAGAQARKRGVRLMREASHQLGTLEARGEAAWRRLTTPYRRDAVRLLQRLEKSIAPPPKRAPARKKKTAARKR